MASLDAQARAAGEAKRQSVLRTMLESRSRAPRLYVKALLLHHILAGSVPPDPKLALDLEALVQDNPEAAREVICALQLAIADGGGYEAIVKVLHSMLARHALRKALEDM